MAESQKEKFMEAHRTLHNLQARDEAYAQLKEALEVAMEAADYVDDNNSLIADKRKEYEELAEEVTGMQNSLAELVKDYNKRAADLEDVLDEKAIRHQEKMAGIQAAHEDKMKGYRKLLVDLEQEVRQLQSQVDTEKRDAQQAIANFQSDVLEWEEKANQAREAARAILGG
jgi:chromosome segregation ATPase